MKPSVKYRRIAGFARTTDGRGRSLVGYVDRREVRRMARAKTAKQPGKADDLATMYRNFRTGLTFADVKQMMWSPSPDPAEWRYRRRPAVLGYWHQLKLQLFEQVIDAMEAEHE